MGEVGGAWFITLVPALQIKGKLEERQQRQAKLSADKQARAANRSPEDRPRRKPLPDHLRRIDIDVDVSPEDKHAMGDDWVFIGWELIAKLYKLEERVAKLSGEEKLIRTFTLGRKKWLYSASPRGAHASDFIYSLVESAKACGLEPRAYMQVLFEKYPLATTVEQRRQLLPRFLKIAETLGRGNSVVACRFTFLLIGPVGNGRVTCAIFWSAKNIDRLRSLRMFFVFNLFIYIIVFVRTN